MNEKTDVEKVETAVRTLDELLAVIDGGTYNYGKRHVRSDLAYLRDVLGSEGEGL